MTRKTKTYCILLAALVVLAVVGAEVYLRLYWGLCDAVLMQASDKYEYIAQPGQKRVRFRNHVEYNEYSMRSKPLSDADSVRILFFGDSVLNGGVQTDQDSLATTIMENILTARYGYPVRCLNISSGSWGPDNCYAYLEEKGDFGADLIVLVLNSHDAYDNMEFLPVIDVNMSYPSKQYKLALCELVERYAIPRLTKRANYNGDRIVKGNVFNSGFGNFHDYSLEHGVPVVVYLHADLNEVAQGCYDDQGEAIIGFCEREGMPLIKGIEHETQDMFRDKIHFNDRGQRALAETLMPELENLLDKNRL